MQLNFSTFSRNPKYGTQITLFKAIKVQVKISFVIDVATWGLEHFCFVPSFILNKSRHIPLYIMTRLENISELPSSRAESAKAVWEIH
jgi:hypothetical protein